MEGVGTLDLGRFLNIREKKWNIKSYHDENKTYHQQYRQIRQCLR